MRRSCLHDDISFALTFQNETPPYSVWRESAKTSTSKWCIYPSAYYFIDSGVVVERKTYADLRSPS